MFQNFQKSLRLFQTKQILSNYTSPFIKFHKPNSLISFHKNFSTSSMLPDPHRTSFLSQGHKEIYDRILKLLSYGEIYVGALDLRGAHRKYQEALQLSEETFGSEETETAISMHKLGDLYQIEGQFAFSMELYSQAMNVFSKNEAENESLIAGVNHSVGLQYKHTEKYSKAIEYLLKAANSWNNLEEPDKALVSLKFALEIIEKGTIEDSFIIANIYELLGDIYTQYDDFYLAREFLTKSKNLKEKEFRKNDPRLGSVYILEGFLARREDNLEEAVKLIKKGIKICSKSEDSNLITLARGYAVLGSIEETQEKYDKALEHFYVSYNLFIKAIKRPNDIRLAKVLSYIGTEHFYQGNDIKSLECFQKSLEMTQKIQTNDTEFLATLYKNLGTLYINFSDYDKAKESLEKAISLKEQLNHSEGNQCLELAFLYRKLGIVNANMLKLENAKECFEKSLMIYTKEYGEFDEETRLTLKLLDETKIRINDLQKVEMGN